MRTIEQLRAAAARRSRKPVQRPPAGPPRYSWAEIEALGARRIRAGTCCDTDIHDLPAIAQARLAGIHALLASGRLRFVVTR